MVSSAYSDLPDVDIVTGVSAGEKFCVGARKLPLKLLNRYNIIRGVVWHNNCNDTMLWRSAQLLLTPENEHFEGRAKIRQQKIWVILRSSTKRTYSKFLTCCNASNIWGLRIGRAYHICDRSKPKFQKIDQFFLNQNREINANAMRKNILKMYLGFRQISIYKYRQRVPRIHPLPPLDLNWSI